MRYYLIAQDRLSPHLRWHHFAERRPWFDRDAPEVTVFLGLFGPDMAEARIVARDRAGAELPCELGPPEGLPPGLPLFRGQPAEHRQVTAARIRFPGPQPVTILDARDDTALLTLTPQIEFPAPLFAVLQEARERFLPGGFANFVETGTLFAHTTLHASHWFENVITIELSPDLAAMARRSLAHRPNARVLEGNSAQVLPEVIAGLSGPSLFFLDAHWSGDSSVNWDGALFAGYPVDTARITAEEGLVEAERQVPLKAELEEIAASHAAPALVLIDDWGSVGRQGYAFAGEDWSHLDRAALTEWMAAHPRTFDHFPADPKRYVWMLNGS